MFHLDVMSKKVAHFHKTLKAYTIFKGQAKHIFAVMKTTGSISLKIWNKTFLNMGLNLGLK